MKPDKVTVADLFQHRRRYVVPIYQRHYVWTEQDQWQGLWEDLEAKAIDRLAAAGGRHPHYMGAVVLNGIGPSSARDVPACEVIDGQQRLTTLQILLIVIRDVAAALELDALKGTAALHVVNDHPELTRNPEVDVHRLWPTHHDRETYLTIQGAGSREAVRAAFAQFFPRGKDRLAKIGMRDQPALLKAYIFFYDRIRDFATQPNEGAVGDRLDALLTALLQDFRLVEIQLEGDDDPQLIFETLNDRGQPLLASDLIRNFIFLRATKASSTSAVERLFDKRWRPLEEPFWSQDEQRGRLKRPRIEFFLLQYLSARTGAEVSLARLFAEYKDFVRGPHRLATVEAELEEILRYATVYRQLAEGTGDDALARVGRRLRAWDVSTAYPPILTLAVSGISEEEKAQAFDDIVSYVVRRAVVGGTAANYNNIFLALARELNAKGASAATVRAYLAGLEGQSSGWPSDAEFRHAWLEQPVYETVKPSGRVRALLMALEENSRGAKVDPAPMPSGLWIEHLMPQAWSTYWPFPDGSRPSAQEQYDLQRVGRPSAEANAAAQPRLAMIARRDRLVHSIGNLTLHTDALGTSIGNQDFAAKQAAFREYGLLQITKSFTRTDVVSWDETAIQKRGAELFEIARRIWPRPETTAP